MPIDHLGAVLAVQRGEPHRPNLVVTQDLLDRPVAQRAYAVVQQDRGLLVHRTSASEPTGGVPIAGCHKVQA
ncbi:Uncharacterised protein [Mycobacteroides abscessus subsp. abscessus]|nr:Uncharacterised protein [Mycobacteroides abscessus subsp. abscessus]